MMLSLWCLVGAGERNRDIEQDPWAGDQSIAGKEQNTVSGLGDCCGENTETAYPIKGKNGAAVNSGV